MPLLLTDGLAALGGTIEPTPRREEPVATGSSLASCPYLATYKVVRNAGQIDLPSPLGARTKEKSLPASHPGPREGKSGGKSGEKIEEVISRPCVTDEVCSS